MNTVQLMDFQVLWRVHSDGTEILCICCRFVIAKKSMYLKSALTDFAASHHHSHSKIHWFVVNFDFHIKVKWENLKQICIISATFINMLQGENPQHKSILTWIPCGFSLSVWMTILSLIHSVIRCGCSIHKSTIHPLSTIHYTWGSVTAPYSLWFCGCYYEAGTMQDNVWLALLVRLHSWSNVMTGYAIISWFRIQQTDPNQSIAII